jgi:tetratricopeptide (TPR) repeat protein
MKNSVSFTALCLLGTLLGVLQLERTSPDFNAGRRAMKQKNYSQAVYYYTRALTSHPNNSYLYTVRGISYLLLEQYQLAFNDSNTGISINPSFAQLYLNRGRSYFALGYRNIAAVDYRTCMNLARNAGDSELYGFCSKLLEGTSTSNVPGVNSSGTATNSSILQQGYNNGNSYIK